MRVDAPDPLDLSTEAIAHRNCKSRIAVVRFKPFQTPIKRVSVMPYLLFQTLDVVLKGRDDGLVEDFPLPNGQHQAFGDPVEGDAVHVIVLEDVIGSSG